MIELQTVTTKAKNPSTNEFQDVTWGGINVLSTSGTTNYNNLTNKPTINGVTVQGSLTTGDLLITAADVGALPSGTKYGADFALSIDSQTFVVTAQLKDQDGNNLGQAKTIDLPLETMVVSGSYDDTTQKIILTLKNGQTVEFSVADLVSGLQSEITLSNKLDADLVSDVSSENKFVTTAEKATWNAKANANEVYTKKQTDSAIETAIGALDVSSVGGSGKYISAISETDGKISPTVETMDTVPTNGSTKAVTSGGVQAPLAEVVDNGAKNLLNCSLTALKSDSYNSGGAYQFTWNGNVCTSARGVTFTINSDNSIDVVATSVTSDVWFRLKQNFQYGVGSYVISGCPSGGSTTTYFIESDNLNARDTGSSIVINRSSAYTDNIFLVVKTGTTFTGTFKPMICTKAEWDISHQFEPYAKTNLELTVAEDEDRAALAEVVDAGAKNLLQFDVLGANTTNIGTSVVVNGVRFTMNSDKSVTVNRESSSSQSAYVWFRNSDGSAVYVTDFCDDVHVFSGAAGASVSTYTLFINNINGSGTYKYFGEGEIIGVPQVTPNAAGISISADYSPSNLVIKPMICTKAEWDVSHAYSPYALSNPVITPALIEQVDSGAKNVLNSIATTGSSGSLSWTVASDGTITVNGTNDTDGRVDIHLFGIEYLPNIYSGMLLSGCKNGSTSGQNPYYILALYSNNGIVWESEKTQYDAPIIIKDSPYCRISIMVPKNSTLNNVVFKPMICTLADWNVSQKYVPYRPSLQDLVVQKATNVVTGTTTLSGTGVSIALKGGNIYRLTANAKYKGVNFSEIAIKYTISGTTYSVCSNAITPTSNVVYLTTTGLVNPSSNVTVEAYVKTETNGNVEILLLAEKIYAN